MKVFNLDLKKNWERSKKLLNKNSCEKEEAIEVQIG